MELSQVVRHDNRLEATWTSVCTFLRQYSSGMSKQYGTVFESLTRSTTPFGGNVLAGAHEQSRTRMYLSQQEIREQVDRLTREITRLNTRVTSMDATTQSQQTNTHPTQSIGIDRFRQESPNTPAA
jgi:hypothetical protein